MKVCRFCGKEILNYNKVFCCLECAKKGQSEITKRSWANPITRENHMKALIIPDMKILWDNEEWAKERRKLQRTPECRKLRSEKTIAYCNGNPESNSPEVAERLKKERHVKASEAQKKHHREHPETALKHGEKIKVLFANNPELRIERGKITNNWHKNPANRKNHKVASDKWREDNPELAHEGSVKGGKTSARKYRGAFFDKWREENPELAREQCIKGGRAGLKALREGLPYWYEGVPFASNEEREVAKMINRMLNVTLIEEVTCHVHIGRIIGWIEADFVLYNKKVIIEYHPPHWRDEAPETYYPRRRRELNENGYHDYKLLVPENLKEAKQYIRELI